MALWLAIFALRFPGDVATGWRRGVQRILAWCIAPLALLNVWSFAGFFAGTTPPRSVFTFFAICNGVGIAFAASTFVLTYVHAPPADRARIRWVMLGLVMGFGGGLVYQVATAVPGVASVLPLWFLNLAQAVQIFVAISVAYAIARYRVFDVRFFIGRAVVYAILTAAVVATLALVDFAVEKVLSGTGLAALGEAGARRRRRTFPERAT